MGCFSPSKRRPPKPPGSTTAPAPSPAPPTAESVASPTATAKRSLSGQEQAELAAKQAAKQAKLAAQTRAINELINKSSRDRAALRERRKTSTDSDAASSNSQRGPPSSSRVAPAAAKVARPHLALPPSGAPSAAPEGGGSSRRRHRRDVPAVRTSRPESQPSSSPPPPPISSLAARRRCQTSRADVRRPRPEVLITAVPHDGATGLALPAVTPEALAVQSAFGGDTRAEVAMNMSVSALDEALSGRRAWFFCGHGDVPLAGECVLGFHGLAGAQESISVDALVAIVKPHVLWGRLQLVVLTGCRTLALAMALRERAFCPYVLCWETLLLDEAAQIFDTAFAAATAAAHEPHQAFEAACRAVTTVTEPGHLDTGAACDVQKFELHVDPLDYERVWPTYPLTHRSGRMRQHAPMAGRGRLAVGKPRLLLPDETKLHSVPSLPAHYMPRPEQGALRAALVGGVDESAWLAEAIVDACARGEGRPQLLLSDAAGPRGGAGDGFGTGGVGGVMPGGAGVGGVMPGMAPGAGGAALSLGGGSTALPLGSLAAPPTALPQPHLPFAGLAGGAGLGKSCLAAWLCRDTIVRTAFRDGCYWLELKREDSGLDAIAALARMLGASPEEVDGRRRRDDAASAGAAASPLTDDVARRLHGKHCLIVLDDVTDAQQPRPFRRLVGGAGGVTVLITSRRTQIIDSYGCELCPGLAPLEAGAARRLLMSVCGRPPAELTHPPENASALDSLVSLSAGLPAMLRSAGRMCAGRSPTAVVHYFETHRTSARLPRSMARSDGYQLEASRGNLFLAYEVGAAARRTEPCEPCEPCEPFANPEGRGPHTAGRGVGHAAAPAGRGVGHAYAYAWGGGVPHASARALRCAEMR